MSQPDSLIIPDSVKQLKEAKEATAGVAAPGGGEPSVEGAFAPSGSGGLAACSTNLMINNEINDNFSEAEKKELVLSYDVVSPEASEERSLRYAREKAANRELNEYIYRPKFSLLQRRKHCFAIRFSFGVAVGLAKGFRFRSFVLTESDEALEFGIPFMRYFHQFMVELRHLCPDIEYLVVEHESVDSPASRVTGAKRHDYHVYTYGSDILPVRKLESIWERLYKSKVTGMQEEKNLQSKIGYLVNYNVGSGRKGHHHLFIRSWQSKGWIYPGWTKLSNAFWREYGRYPTLCETVTLALMSDYARARLPVSIISKLESAPISSVQSRGILPQNECYRRPLTGGVSSQQAGFVSTPPRNAPPFPAALHWDLGVVSLAEPVSIGLRSLVHGAGRRRASGGHSGASGKGSGKALAKYAVWYVASLGGKKMIDFSGCAFFNKVNICKIRRIPMIDYSRFEGVIPEDSPQCLMCSGDLVEFNLHTDVLPRPADLESDFGLYCGSCGVWYESDGLGSLVLFTGD